MPEGGGGGGAELPGDSVGLGGSTVTDPRGNETFAVVPLSKGLKATCEYIPAIDSEPAAPHAIVVQASTGEEPNRAENISKSSDIDQESPSTMRLDGVSEFQAQTSPVTPAVGETYCGLAEQLDGHPIALSQDTAMLGKLEIRTVSQGM